MTDMNIKIKNNNVNNCYNAKKNSYVKKKAFGFSNVKPSNMF